jgi:outer membrane protein insertion porin family
LAQRAKHSYAFLLAAALAVALTGLPSRALAQPGGSGMSDIPTAANSIFGKKKDNREISGPTLSATDEPVADIRIVGNTTIPTAQILNQLQTRIGRPFDPALVQRDVRKLTARGWFVDVQPTYEQAGKGRIVIFKVIERPVVRYVEYLGNYEVRTKKLSKETDLKVGGPVDPYAVQEAKRKLIDLYHRDGFNNAQVSILEGDKPTDHGIVFVINEGQSQKIWKVEFIGNEFVSERRLRTKVDSKPPILYIFKGYVDRDEIDADVNKLTAFYRSFGYFQAKIGRELVFDEKNKWLTLRFVIHEGPRYQVESVAFIGNRLFASDSLTIGVDLKNDPTPGPNAFVRAYHHFFPLPPGPQPFEQDRMNADVAWLKELYGSQGYIFADIRAEPIFLEQEGRLKLLYHIEEGKRWRVGNVFVHINGDNPHTKIETALNRLSLKSGQIADIREIHASERRLQASGLFMTDPSHGVSPKITYHIPEVGDKQTASKDSSGFRGQSPDDDDQPADGAPLLPPPNANLEAALANTQTYQVPAPAGYAHNEEDIDIHLYVENPIEDVPSPAANTQPVSTVSAYQALTPAPQVYEVRRPPYDDNTATAQPVVTTWPNSATTASDTNTYSQTAAPAGSNPYGGLIVRTQSPYQPSTGPAYTPPGAPAPSYPTNPYPAPAAAPSSAERYGSTAYGGQTVGPTGPDAVPPGGTQYPVRQAAITEPQIPPNPSTAPIPVYNGPPAVEQLPVPPGAPQYAPGPQPMPGGPIYNGPTTMAPPPSLAPPPASPNSLAPSPNITPLGPVPNSTGPTDSFTPMFTDPAVDMDVVLSENQTGRLMLGVAVNSDAGLVGQILLDEQNFDWRRYPTTWEDVVSGRAWRGAGEHFRLEAAPGTQVQRYLASFTEPYLLDTPVSLGLSGSYFTRQYRDWDEQRTGGRVSLGYQWVENDLSTAISYRGEDVKISNPSNPALPELAEVVGDNTIHGFKYSIANDTRDSAFLATEGHFLQLELEEVVGSFQFPRAVLDGRQYFLLDERPDHSGRHVLTLSSRVGVTGSNTPIFENFFAGGFSTLRGFDFRGASPIVQNVQVGGQFEWLNTVEYLFPLTADDMIHGVAFCDFGTVEENIAIHGDNFRVAPGVGLRITVPAMGPAPIALDFAFPILSAPTDQKQVFSFNIGLQR